MSLLTFSKVSLSFSGRQIFSEIGFQVHLKDCIGLVGPNGSGKTSLLRLIMGRVVPDSGEVRAVKGVRIGYLPQDVLDAQPGKLLQSIVDSAPGRIEGEEELRSLESSLRTTTCEQDQTRLAEKLAAIHEEVARVDFCYPRHEAEKILLGLGFELSDFGREISSLSGGWRTRAALAGLLFQRPDLLLLDEPTNHLDIPSVHWLETFLETYTGAMILVSHDRDFLNRQVKRVLSFEPEGMRVFNGNYDAYLKARESEEITLAANAKKQEQRVKEAKKFIERFRAKASKARQAQSKIKLLDKMELVKTHSKEKTTRFSFPEVSRSGRVVLSIEGLTKGFNEKTLYRDLTLSVLRGERIALIGPNGCGKTTLLKIVAGELAPDHGKITLGHGVGMGYFAQHQSEILNPQRTVLEEVYHDVPDKTLGFVRGVCGAFLFSGSEVDKVVAVLSGGEKARVALAKLLVKPGNFMVMDEPTNHLDLSSSEALISALADYGGTLLFVSHNQSFINRLATKIWDLRKGELLEYPGNLDEYYLQTANTESQANEAAIQQNQNSQPVDGSLSVRSEKDRKSEKRIEAERRQMRYKALKPILSETELLEKRISELEERQQEIEKLLADPGVFSDKSRGVPLLGEYKTLKEELGELLARWEYNQEQLEEIQKEI
jgi:ATP-binding cassette, subfamily F, member 3